MAISGGNRRVHYLVIGRSDFRTLVARRMRGGGRALRGVLGRALLAPPCHVERRGSVAGRPRRLIGLAGRARPTFMLQFFLVLPCVFLCSLLFRLCFVLPCALCFLCVPCALCFLCVPCSLCLLVCPLCFALPDALCFLVCPLCVVVPCVLLVLASPCPGFALGMLGRRAGKPQP